MSFRIFQFIVIHTVKVVGLEDINRFLPSSLEKNHLRAEPDSHGYIEELWTLWSDMWEENPKKVPSKGLAC